MIPALELKDATVIVTGIVMVTSVIVGLKYVVIQVKAGQGELLRQVLAVHRRMDDYGKRLVRAERNQAVLRERVANIRRAREVPQKDTG